MDEHRASDPILSEADVERLLQFLLEVPGAAEDMHLPEEQVTAYYEGDLPEADVERIDRHLASCEKCALWMERRLTSPQAAPVLRQAARLYRPRPVETSPRMAKSFDVFLSHNSKDEPAVRELAEALRDRGLKVWLDEWELVPGRPWQEAVEAIIETTRSSAVLVSKNGLGPWQDVEMQGCLSEFVNRGLSVIPVLLPGAPEVPRLPLFLKRYTWVDLRGGLTEEGLDRLEWGITGEKPLGESRTRFSSVPEPRYENDRTRELGEQLAAAYRRFKEISIAGEDTADVREQILALRRALREGERLQAGEWLGEDRFQLLEIVGRGGFATVWKAWDEERRALVAVKVLHGQHAEDRTRRERFFRGARKMAELHHPGIVRVIEAELEENGKYFFVMDYVEGGDLRGAVLAGKLPQEKVLPVVMAVGDALTYAHEKGVIHRDVKPANILLDRGQPKLTDFDLVRAFDTTGGTQTQGLLGTVLFSSPEMLNAAKDASVAADVYSLAMTTVFAFHGRDIPPDVLRFPEAFLKKLPCPPALREAFSRGISWEPEDRPASVALLCEELRLAAAASRAGKKRRGKAPIHSRERAPGSEPPEAAPAGGVDGTTGEPLYPPTSFAEMDALARGSGLGAQQIVTMVDQQWQRGSSVRSLGVRDGFISHDLASSGWGVIFPQHIDPEVREALTPLIEHRRRQATARAEHRFREIYYRPDESKRTFLGRFGIAPSGKTDPDRLPYYLLLAGSPEEIPWSFQHQLDAQCAVGRLCFDTADEYAHYAETVIAAETGKIVLPRRLILFGPRHDRSTELMADHLIAPLGAALSSSFYPVETILGSEATKERLIRLLGGGDKPALLFTAQHGMGFPAGHPQQFAHQGALLCQHWPGSGPIGPDIYLSGDDVAEGACPAGLVAFFYVCHGAGTPQYDLYSQRHSLSGIAASAQVPRRLAPESFVASLPRRLLGHPAGGALAVISHVERTWGYSFLWQGVGPQTQVFEDCLKRLLDGYPVGTALEPFKLRLGALARELTSLLQEDSYGKPVDARDLVSLWTAHNDAYAYALLGDPAVRLAIQGDSG